jgi:hypothetical protein
MRQFLQNNRLPHPTPHVLVFLKLLILPKNSSAMAEIPAPSLPDAHIVRTYPKDYAASDTESEGEAHFEVDTIEEEEQHSISRRLQQNQEYMDQQTTPLAGENSGWMLEPQSWETTEGTPVVLITQPAASNMSHRLLNPFIYRNIRNVGTLNDLAALLDTPDDWEERCNNVIADSRIVSQMEYFRNLPDDTAESTIQVHFVGLVSAISVYLGILILPDTETKIIVGGILARVQYDLRSKTDPHVLNTSGRNLIASEAKTHRTFGIGEMWYHQSRGIQVLSAMYAFNAPTFLFSHRQWKLFVENTERNAIFTFPYNDNPEHTPHVNSSQIEPMGTTFLKAIVICLLSRRVSLDCFDTRKNPVRMSTKPSILSGYDDKGQPIYSLVRVVPQEVVSRLEDDIAVQEKSRYQKRTSEMKLFE